MSPVKLLLVTFGAVLCTVFLGWIALHSYWSGKMESMTGALILGSLALAASALGIYGIRETFRGCRWW